jgi:hypothetical protein
MSSMSPVKYRLVVFGKPEETEPVRDFLAKSLGIHPLDALRLTAHMPGILPGLFDAQTSKKVLDGFFELKIPAEARSADTFPDLSRPRSVQDLTLTGGGINIRDNVRKQTLHFLPWNRIGLIAAGRIQMPDTVIDYVPPGITRNVVYGVRRMLGGGSLNRKERSVRSPGFPKGEAILWRREPHGVFRLSEDKLRYDILGEHRAETAAENFPRLIKWLAVGAETAFLTDSTQSYIGETGAEPEIFPDEESLIESATMQLLKSWYRQDREKAGS